MRSKFLIDPLQILVLGVYKTTTAAFAQGSRAWLHLPVQSRSEQAFASVVMLLSLVFSPALSAQTLHTGTLTVRVVNARNASGEIRVALFKDGQGFPGDASKAFRTQGAQIDPQTMSAQVVFTGIPQGVYAVSVFHDENGNGKLDKNLVGIPKEGYGASNNPPKKMRPPTFDEAKFSLGTQQSLEIRLIH
jgi:uncharacterized protein (DUF2141 family)